jgi:hypothetical protein
MFVIGVSAFDLKTDGLQRVCKSRIPADLSALKIGGEGGSRTHGTVTRTTVFEF